MRELPELAGGDRSIALSHGSRLFERVLEAPALAGAVTSIRVVDISQARSASRGLRRQRRVFRHWGTGVVCGAANCPGSPCWRGRDRGAPFRRGRARRRHAGPRGRYAAAIRSDSRRLAVVADAAGAARWRGAAAITTGGQVAVIAKSG
jgi:hypothetical protein